MDSLPEFWIFCGILDMPLNLVDCPYCVILYFTLEIDVPCSSHGNLYVGCIEKMYKSTFFHIIICYCV